MEGKYNVISPRCARISARIMVTAKFVTRVRLSTGDKAATQPSEFVDPFENHLDWSGPHGEFRVVFLNVDIADQEAAGFE